MRGCLDNACLNWLKLCGNVAKQLRYSLKYPAPQHHRFTLTASLAQESKCTESPAFHRLLLCDALQRLVQVGKQNERSGRKLIGLKLAARELIGYSRYKTLELDSLAEATVSREQLTEQEQVAPHFLPVLRLILFGMPDFRTCGPVDAQQRDQAAP